MLKNLDGKNILITGGTGSLGKVLLRRLLTGEMGTPNKISIFSRDEGKQHAIRVHYQGNTKNPTDEVIYHNFQKQVQFHIGDVRDLNSLYEAVSDAHVVIHAAALKQVPSCEYFPEEAALTNVMGAVNLVRAVKRFGKNVEVVVGISTDKACKPVNVMGMTKSIQERVILRGGVGEGNTRYMAVRYGNVLASRGSVIPLFHEQIQKGGPVTITDEKMTRFLLSLDDAVDIVFEALLNGDNGETYIPQVPSALVTDIAKILIGERNIEIKVTGIRPGEKLHEILISEEEALRTFKRGEYFVISSILPEIESPELSDNTRLEKKEYSSADSIMNENALLELMKKHNLMLGDKFEYLGEEMIA